MGEMVNQVASEVQKEPEQEPQTIETCEHREVKESTTGKKLHDVARKANPIYSSNRAKRSSSSLMTNEEMQTKAFTRWINSHLKYADLVVTDLKTDLKDGIGICVLAELLFGSKIKYNQKVKLPIHMLENLTSGLKALSAAGVKFTNIASGDVHDGNLKLILGLIWCTILKYQMGDVGLDSLLKWCQGQTVRYDNVEIEDYTSSFQDGMALCAILDNQHPGQLKLAHKVPFEFSKLDPEQPIHNLTVSFQIANKYWDVPSILDASDVATGYYSFFPCSTFKHLNKLYVIYIQHNGR